MGAFWPTPALRSGADAAERTRPPVVAHVPVALTGDRATALQAGRQAIRINASLPVYRNMFGAAGFSQQDITTVSDSLVESLVVFGDESKIKDRFMELLAMGLDELTISLVAVRDPVQERTRLAQLIGQW